MNKIISLIVAVVVFWLVEFILVPMLPAPIRTIVSVLVVIAAIVYALSLFTNYAWPWTK